MMGDPGTSDSKLLYPSLGIRQRDEFHVPAPGSVLEPSDPSFSNSLRGQHPLFLPSLHQHPAVSFRPAGSEACSNRDFEGGSVGPRNCALDPIQNRSCHSEDTLDVMARARVGEDDLLTFPEGEVDAVTITARDLASLQPGKFLTDNIVDFYVKHLKVKAISPEHQNRFHFFNSFFFRKLLEKSASLGVDECRVDYVQLREWVGGVNLFEKDFVFVPVIVSSHWSLLVICHLRSLNPSSPGERKGSPCILHLDPIEGKHELYEGQVKSFIFQAWAERIGASNNLDILHSLVQMKYVQAKVPQQGNGYDCGLYVLHYIEVFLLKSTLQDLIVSSLEGGAHFTWPNFRVEVLDKRNYIRCLIFRLRGMLQDDDGNHLSIPPMPPKEVGFVPSQNHCHQGSPKVVKEMKIVKEMKSKKWKEIETLVLLQCVVGGGRFSKGKLGAVHWDLIAKEINLKNNCGPLRSKEQCQNRFDTLLKAYKDLNAYCLREGKDFCNVTEDEKRSLKLATPLGEKHEDWYNHLHTIYVQRSSSRGESHKRPKPNPNGDIDVNKLASSLVYPFQESSLPLDGIGIGSSKSMKPSPSQVIVQKFDALDVALRYTFLNLIQVWSLEMWWGYPYLDVADMSLERLCRRLAIVQDESPLLIRKHVYELRNLKLVKLYDMEFDEYWGDCWGDKKRLDISNAKVYKTLGSKVLSKNPHLNTFCKLSGSAMLATELCLVQEIRVLILYKCGELENVDLGNFPTLRYLDIANCAKLKVVNGWEGAKQLGWITIWDCCSYCDLPGVQFPTFLKEFFFASGGMQRIPWQLANFSQCVQLRRLEICDDKGLVESMDLKALRFLEVLSFEGCSALSTINGLSGLLALMKLNVSKCISLKMVPDLGCLKTLLYLDMHLSGIIEIPGVEELHLLTSLTLCQCRSLESLPPLSHLKALVLLDFRWSSIEEIRGVEDLVSLETFWCGGSKLKRLPNLEHLCQLRRISIDGTPLECIHHGLSLEDMS